MLRHEQARSLRRGADGTPLPDNLAPGVFFGDDLRLQLTLDSRLQELSAKALTDQVKKWKAKKGAVIVMDATNGEVLVLASTPTYDPNQFWKFHPGVFGNGRFRIFTSRVRPSSRSIWPWLSRRA